MGSNIYTTFYIVESLQLLPAAIRLNTTRTILFSDIDLLLKQINKIRDEFVRNSVDSEIVNYKLVRG